MSKCKFGQLNTLIDVLSSGSVTIRKCWELCDADRVVVFQDTRQRQERVDRDSQEFANLEFMIDGATDVGASIQEELKVLQSSPRA